MADLKKLAEELDLLPGDLTRSEIVVATLLTMLIFW